MECGVSQNGCGNIVGCHYDKSFGTDDFKKVEVLERGAMAYLFEIGVAVGLTLPEMLCNFLCGALAYRLGYGGNADCCQCEKE